MKRLQSVRVKINFYKEKGEKRMCNVAKFQFEAQDIPATIGTDTVRVVERWGDRKFAHASDGSTTIRRSGVSALFDRQAEVVGEMRLTTFTVLEPVEGGELQTLVRILESPKRISFQCTLGIGSEGGMAPPSVSLGSPRFIREVIDLGYPWTLGNSNERVFCHSFPVDVEEVENLEALLTSSHRRLPLVVISELDGETLAGDLHERIGANVCGLAHTVRLSADASWDLTKRLGQEWSCFNGAVRLFWPFRNNRDNPRAHPLWTLDWILSRAETAKIARDRFIALITRNLIEASTFVADDPRFHEFESARLRNATEAARTVASESGDLKELAHAYAAENEALRRKVADQERELEDLRQNVEALAIALRAAQAEPEEATDEVPPATVAEAVEIARRELKSSLVIASESEKHWLNLNPVAGPPEKILRYLRTLGRMSDLLAQGTPLGTSIPIWLRQQNIECSGDSKTAKEGRTEKAFRTRSVEGEVLECDFHAKPSDGTSPDMCVRIYFKVVDDRPKVRIGYIGRHAE